MRACVGGWRIRWIIQKVFFLVPFHLEEFSGRVACVFYEVNVHRLYRSAL